MSNTKKITENKTVATTTATKVETVKLGTTTYHYWRNWVKQILQEGSVISAKFVKTESYNGYINIAKAEKVKATKLINDYVKKENSVELVTFIK